MIPVHLVTARDWQAIAQREAADLLGSPEALAKLAESKRYGALADQLHAQAKEIEALRIAGGLIIEGYLVILRDGHKCRMPPDKPRAELFAAQNHGTVEPMYVKRPQQSEKPDAP